MLRAALWVILTVVLTWLPVSAGQAACPPPLPLSAYATRCTGGAVRLPGGALWRDCPRGERPAMPMAPALTSLVEKLRCEVGDKVAVTSGYRSQAHNTFLWAWVEAREPGRNAVSRHSRHTAGSAVDLVVKGYSAADLTSLAGKLRQWAGRPAKPLRGSIESVWIRVYRAGEGREPDNLHAFPYIHIELRR